MVGPIRTGCWSSSTATFRHGTDGSMSSSCRIRTRTTWRVSRCSSTAIGSVACSSPGCVGQGPAMRRGQSGSVGLAHRSASGSRPVIDSRLTTSRCVSCGRTGERCRQSHPTPGRASTTSRSSCSARSMDGDSCSRATSSRGSIRSSWPVASRGWTFSRSPTMAAGRRRPRRSWTRPVPPSRSRRRAPAIPMVTRPGPPWTGCARLVRGSTEPTAMAQ